MRKSPRRFRSPYLRSTRLATDIQNYIQDFAPAYNSSIHTFESLIEEKDADETIPYLLDNNLLQINDIQRALELAVIHDRVVVVDRLLNIGGSLNNVYTRTVAIENGSLNTIKYMVEHGINMINGAMLIVAVVSGQIEIVKYFIEQGLNPNDYNGAALIAACEDGHLNIVKYLVENGADVNVQDGAAVLMAYKNKHINILKYLISKGAII